MWKLLFAFLLISSPAVGAGAHDPYKPGSKFSMTFERGITVKNQDVLFGRRRRGYTYGDTCMPAGDGTFKVVERAEGVVRVVYSITFLYGENECPDGTVTTFTVNELADAARYYARQLEDQLFKGLEGAVKR